jgi:hypothetical protein
VGADEVAVHLLFNEAEEVAVQAALQCSLRGCCLGCSSVGADEMAVQAALLWGLMMWLFRLLFSGD